MTKNKVISKIFGIALVFVMIVVVCLGAVAPQPVVGTAEASDPPCTCGDICVNETGWWPVGGTFNASATPIQSAVDNATAGETICVKDGNYTENVTVNKAVSLLGENLGNTTVVGGFKVTADNVTIENFTITGGYEWDPDGVGLGGAYRAGIYADNCDNVRIYNNRIGNVTGGTGGTGRIDGSGGSGGVGCGIYLSSSTGDNLTSNTIGNVTGGTGGTGGVQDSGGSGGVGCGIYLSSSTAGNLTSNTIENVTGGTRGTGGFMGPGGSGGVGYGFYLESSDNSAFENNTASNNDYGIYLSSSSGNTIYNNYFSNTYNANDNGNNAWNITKTLGPNIAGGPYLGGNYWSDYSTKYPNATEIGSTGIWDTPYNITGDSNKDYLPLVAVPPVHNVNTGENFSAIQNAIDDSNTTSGHTITVDPGTYNENVDVNKQLTIRSTSGNPADTIVSASSSSDHVFDVSADWVNIMGFMVKGATVSDRAGIRVTGANHCNISSNNVTNNYYGIYLDSSSNNNIYNNYFNNTNNAYDDGTNTWNTTKQAGTNIIGGPYLGGNYWSDYSGSDTNGDGFGDTPYNITGDANKDYLPLVSYMGVMRNLPGVAEMPNETYPGDTFDVYVNFTAPVDNFNSIGLTDLAPAGWEVETDVNWCSPVADWTMSPGNKAEYAWNGPFSEGTNFSARYEVTIPATASPGINEWPDCTPIPCPPCEGSPINSYAVWVEYWFGAEGPYESCITGDWQKIVTVPGCVVGETRDVNGDLLDTVLVTLYETVADWEDDDSSSIVGNVTKYENCADDTGYYWQLAEKYCYYTLDTRNLTDGGDIPTLRNPNYPYYINFTTPELLAAGFTMDFVGDYGLVCKAASMSYAMESINHHLFIPVDEWGVAQPDWKLSNWKAMQSVAAWQFPCGCNC